MLNVACFVQSRLTDADFVIFSNYCLIGTRRTLCDHSIVMNYRTPCTAGRPVLDTEKEICLTAGKAVSFGCNRADEQVQ